MSDKETIIRLKELCQENLLHCLETLLVIAKARTSGGGK